MNITSVSGNVVVVVVAAAAAAAGGVVVGMNSFVLLIHAFLWMLDEHWLLTHVMWNRRGRVMSNFVYALTRCLIR